MPYRRLPNTDRSRLRALTAALHKGETVSINELAFSQKLFVEIKAFQARFNKTIHDYNEAYANQTRKNKLHQELVRKARLYLSHYIQVANLAIIRGEIKPNITEYFGLNEDCNVPDLNTETSLLEWGSKIIEGDQKRVMQGGAPFYNPSMAMVRMQFDKFKGSNREQRLLQQNSNRNQEQVIELRLEADLIIVNLWNQIETYFETLSPMCRLEQCSEYGIVYYLRRKEKKFLASTNNPEDYSQLFSGKEY